MTRGETEYVEAQVAHLLRASGVYERIAHLEAALNDSNTAYLRQMQRIEEMERECVRLAGDRDELRWAVSELSGERAHLREVLHEQWEANHAERCSFEWPHPAGKICAWPMPDVLRGDAMQPSNGPHDPGATS